MAEAVIDAGAVLDERERTRGGLPRRGRVEEEALDAEGAAEIVDELEEREPREVEGARGTPALKTARRTWPAGARTLFAVVGLVAVAIMGFLLWKARHLRQANEGRDGGEKVERVERRVRPLELGAVAPAALSKQPQPAGRAASPGLGVGLEGAQGGPAVAAEGLGGPGNAGGGAGPNEAQTVEQRRLSRGFGGEGEGGGVAGEPAPAGRGTAPAGSAAGGGLQEKLEPLELRAASAGLLPDRNYLMTQGTMLDCVLETRLVSTVAGMTSCHLTRDIYSANGHVVLLDRGSKVVGHYQGGVQQGQNRIFVVWTRAETPNGVVVELDSPGTGALGEGGVGGWVDTHFWDRFGAAILLSIIQDGVDAAAARAAGPQNAGVTFTNQAAAGKEVIAQAMEPTVNIPPTLVVNQGERLGIFVARDLDFRSVYGLERVARAGP